MKQILLATRLVTALGVLLPGPVFAAPALVSADFQALPKPGKRVPLDADHYFTFGFLDQPKLGKAIMRAEIFTNDGQRDRTFTVKGDLDMPSMRGAHSTGLQAFVLSAKGAYLMPVHLAMPGDWEFRFTFEKNGKLVFRGLYLFDL
jgi:hypothetical protein